METIEIEGEFIDQENGVTTIKVNIQELIEILDYDGYTVLQNNQNDLDHYDKVKFEELAEKYLKASWSEREEIYNKIVR